MFRTVAIMYSSIPCRKRDFYALVRSDRSTAVKLFSSALLSWFAGAGPTKIPKLGRHAPRKSTRSSLDATIHDVQAELHEPGRNALCQSECASFPNPAARKIQAQLAQPARDARSHVPRALLPEGAVGEVQREVLEAGWHSTRQVVQTVVAKLGRSRKAAREVQVEVRQRGRQSFGDDFYSPRADRPR